MKVKSLSHAQLFGTPWTVAYQAPPSMEFSRQEYRSGLPFPSPGDLPDPGIEPRPPALQEDTLLSELPGKSLYTWNYLKYRINAITSQHHHGQSSLWLQWKGERETRGVCKSSLDFLIELWWHYELKIRFGVLERHNQSGNTDHSLV